jgi:hypothetical protein
VSTVSRLIEGRGTSVANLRRPEALGFQALRAGQDGQSTHVVAVVLAHELQHALDAKRTDLGLLDVNCVAMEVRGYTAQAAVTRLFWPDELPTVTPIERSLAAVVRSVEQDGPAAVAARLAASPEYRGSCAI